MENAKILIVGGSVAGISAASRARRINEHADITIIEESSTIGYPLSALPLYASGDIKKKETLIQSQEERLINVFNIKVLTSHKAVKINKEAKTLSVKDLTLGKTEDMPYDKLILACGNKFSTPKQLNSSFANIFTLKKLEDAEAIRNYIDKTSAKEITIVGANFYGILTADSFLKKGFEVTLIEQKERILEVFDSEFSYFIRDELEKNGAKIHTGVEIVKFIKEEKDLVNKIELTNKKTVHTQFIIFFDNISPNIELAKQAGLAVGDTNRITVNKNMCTTDPDIFAAGNIAQTFNAITGMGDNNSFIGPAYTQGRVAGSSAAGCEVNYNGLIGTMIIKILDLTIGLTGLNKDRAKKLGYDIFSSVLFSGDRERFLPDARQIHLKILVNNDNRKVIGAQVCSRGKAADKKIDVFATAIYAGMTVDDLINLNLAYNPELNTSRDPVNVLGMISANRLDGLSNPIDIEKVKPGDNICILDIRTKNEHMKAHIENALWIPLDELRSRLDEIPKGRDLYIYSHTGLRGYIAERILKGSGFPKVFNIEGGITSIKISEKVP